MIPIMIITGIPVNTAANRAFAAQSGWTKLAWPLPYPAGSVIMECYRCGGLVWIGPGAQRAATLMTDVPVMCLLCGILTNRGELAMLRLSGNVQAASEGTPGE